MKSVFLSLLLFVSSAFCQQTPSQILSTGSSFQALSARQLEIAEVTLLATLVSVTPQDPGVILSNGAAFQGLDDRSLKIATVTLLSQIQASGGILALNGNGTNTTLWAKTGDVEIRRGDGIHLLTAKQNGGINFSNGLYATSATIDDGSTIAGLNAGNIAVGSVAAGGIGWNTNSTLPPGSTTVIRAWLSVTNDSGKVGKIPVYY